MNTELDNRHRTYYTPQIESFLAEIAETDPAGIPEPHFPVWGENYEKALIKIAIIGEETRGWGEMSHFINQAKTSPIDACRGYEEQFRSFGFTEWTNNFGKTFWDTGLKLIAGVHGISDWKQLKRKEVTQPLTEFLWANTNSIEGFGVTAKHNHTKHEDWEVYKKASLNHLDSLKGILITFQPDIIFILNWDLNENFMDVALEWEDMGSHQRRAHYKPTGTKIIHTAHPTWLNLNGLYDEAVANLITQATQHLSARR